MAYTFDQLFAADPATPGNVAANASVLIFAPGDATKAPLTLTTTAGAPLANPVQVNANGFGPAFMHATLDRVAWEGGGFTGFFTSYEGMKAEAVAARSAADSSAASAATSAGLVNAPADAAVETLINGATTATRGAFNTATSTEVSTAGKAARNALDTVYGQHKTARPGGRGVALGDSITQASDQDSNKTQGASWPNYLTMFSGGRATVINAGIAGNTTAQMLARFDTDVTPHKPSFVALLGGTNDIGQSRSFADWSADVRSIVGKIRTIGAVPVLGTIPPNNDGARRQAITHFNAWLRSYAEAEGLTVINFYALLADPATANFKTAYNNDGTHPNSAGQAAMGQLASDTLTPLLPANSPMIATEDIDWNNLIAKGTFAGASGTGVPEGWIDAAGVPTGSALSYVTDSAVPGQMVKITQNGTTGPRQLAYDQYIGATTLSGATLAGATSLTLPIRADYRGTLFMDSGANFEIAKILSSTGAGPQTETLVGGLKYAHADQVPVIASAAPGDTMIFTGVVTSDGGVTFTVDTAMTGTTYSPTAAKDIPAIVTRGRWYQKFVVPTGATRISYRLTAAAGTGSVQFGQVSVYNATRLGML